MRSVLPRLLLDDEPSDDEAPAEEKPVENEPLKAEMPPPVVEEASPGQSASSSDRPPAKSGETVASFESFKASIGSRCKGDSWADKFAQDARHEEGICVVERLVREDERRQCPAT